MKKTAIIITIAFALIGLSVLAWGAAAPRQGVLSWGMVTTDTEGNPITGVIYNVYRGNSATGGTSGKTIIAADLPGLTYTDTNRPPGVTDCYVVTGELNNIEGGPSAERCKSYPSLAPAQVPGLTLQ